MNSPTIIEIESQVTLFIVLAMGMIVLLFAMAFIVTGNIISAGYGDALAIVFIGLGIVFGAYAGYLHTKASKYRDLLGLTSGYSNEYGVNLNNLASHKVSVPYSFLHLGKNFGTIYRDGLYSYLSGYPNSSLPTIIRCLEIAIKQKYSKSTEEKKNSSLSYSDIEFLKLADDRIRIGREKTKREYAIDDLDLFDLIEASAAYYQNKKDLLQYLRSLRNFIHKSEVISEAEAQLALIKVSEALVDLYPSPDKIDLNVKCNICGNAHEYSVDSTNYTIGNRLILRCNDKNNETTERNFVVTIMP